MRSAFALYQGGNGSRLRHSTTGTTDNGSSQPDSCRGGVLTPASMQPTEQAGAPAGASVGAGGSQLHQQAPPAALAGSGMQAARQAAKAAPQQQHPQQPLGPPQQQTAAQQQLQQQQQAAVEQVMQQAQLQAGYLGAYGEDRGAGQGALGKAGLAPPAA